MKGAFTTAVINEEAELYPEKGFLESSNMSVG
jgi:hypothetical protein